ncbi:MAG: tetratricopeptide repeat protein [Leptospiraceae bacterium]|nr:tetratricopeptide repeat protein [Leptospiraceae bacterium]
MSGLPLLPAVISGQSSPTGERPPYQQPQFADILVEPMEILSGDEVPTGTFRRNARDFILCAGPDFGPNPPPGTHTTINWNKAVYTDVAAFNNETVQQIETADADATDLWHTAAARWQAGLEADPLFWPFVYNAGRVALITGQLETAREHFALSIRLMPQFYGHYINLGRVYAQLKTDQQALTYFRNAAELQSNSIEPLLAIADLYIERDNYRRARDYLDECLHRWPDNTAALSAHARILLKERRPLAAYQMIAEDKLPRNPFDRQVRGDVYHGLYYYRSLALWQIGEFERARTDMDTLLSRPDDAFFLWASRSQLQVMRARIGVR